VALVDDLRSACAFVAREARFVQIGDAQIEPYARSLPPRGEVPGPDPEVWLLEGPVEERAAFALTLEAINFGSGWWPEVRKRPGRSGFYTMALGVRERFDAEGAWSAEELARLSTADVAVVLGQDPAHELIELYARSLRDLGARVGTGYGGSFAAVAQAAAGSAAALVDELGGWESFADVSRYRRRDVPFLKRAQLAAADLHHADVARFGDLERLTLFADNLVPHVLRMDGVLVYDGRLLERIEADELLEHGSREEVEIRACAVEAVERIVRARPDLSAQEVDHLLWNRGREPRYKARPRHRARSTAY
jgi:putative queuosine salvage protein